MQILKTCENNSMSLSCHGEMHIEDGIITRCVFNGYPRTEGRDAWIDYYKSYNKGDHITDETINKILSFNGKNNIVSQLKESKSL